MELIMDEKLKIYLVGDSTVQTYKLEAAPQCGWGAMLYRYFTDNEVRVYHSKGSEFENAVTYEMADLIIDNRAMAGRGLKNFFEEGRFSEVLECIQEGDYCLIQSAHNDAYKEKVERFLTPDEYKEKLKEDYVLPLKNKGAIPVLVTAIAMKDFDADGNCRISFPEYREKMMEVAKELKLTCIDLGKITADYNTKIGEEACKEIYMNLDKDMFESAPEGKEDNAHLKFEGAFVYAGFVARELRKLICEVSSG